MANFRKTFKRSRYLTPGFWHLMYGSRLPVPGSWLLAICFAFVSAFSLNQSFKEGSFFYQQRLHILDFVSPLTTLSHNISENFLKVQDFFYSYRSLQEEICSLREQKESLLKWQHQARLLRQENSALRKQLQTIPDSEFEGYTARVIGRAQSAYTDIFVISGNAIQGVKKNKTVMTAAGIVGRTQEVGAYTTRVLPITDLNSRVPVVVLLQKEALQGTDSYKTIQGIAIGDGQGGLFLNYVSEPQNLSVGDPLYTSGVGGVFPSRLPVGAITKIQGDKIFVSPYFTVSNLEFVIVLGEKKAETALSEVPSSGQ